MQQEAAGHIREGRRGGAQHSREGKRGGGAGCSWKGRWDAARCHGAGRRGISRVQQVKEESSSRVQLSAAEQIREVTVECNSLLLGREEGESSRVQQNREDRKHSRMQQGRKVGCSKMQHDREGGTSKCSEEGRRRGTAERTGHVRKLVGSSSSRGAGRPQLDRVEDSRAWSSRVEQEGGSRQGQWDSTGKGVLGSKAEKWGSRAGRGALGQERGENQQHAAGCSGCSLAGRKMQQHSR